MAIRRKFGQASPTTPRKPGDTGPLRQKFYGGSYNMTTRVDRNDDTLDIVMVSHHSGDHVGPKSLGLSKKALIVTANLNRALLLADDAAERSELLKRAAAPLEPIDPRGDNAFAVLERLSGFVSGRVNTEEIGDYIERLSELQAAPWWLREWFVVRAMFSLCSHAVGAALRELFTARRGA